MDRRVARWEIAILTSILAGLVLLLVARAWTVGVTVDEPSHLLSAYLYWHGEDELPPRDMPPLIKLVGGWVPRILGLPIPYDRKDLMQTHHHEWIIAYEMMDRLRNRTQTVFFYSRLPFIIFPVLTVLLIWHWGRQVFTPVTGILLALAFAMDPTALGHGVLFKNDLASTFGYLLFWYLAWRFWCEPRLKNAAWLGAGLAVAVLSKLSMLFLIGVAPVLVAARHLTLNRRDYRALAAALAVTLLIPYVLSLAACQFETRCMTDADFARFTSEGAIPGPLRIFANLFRWLPYPVPLWDGLVSLIRSNSDGSMVYLFGRPLSRGHPLYFLVAVVVKAPLPFLLLILGGLLLEAASLVRRRFELHSLFWIVPPFLYIGLASLASLQLGVRLVLPALPFGLMIAGRAVAWLLRGRFAWALPVLFTVAAARLIQVYPHPISFFNLLVGDPMRGARILSDSNVDWGQDLRELADLVRRTGIRKLRLSYFGNDSVWAYFSEDQVELVAPPWNDDVAQGTVYKPTRGFYAISASLLPGHMFAERYREFYKAFRQRKPIATAGYSIYLYWVE